MDVFSKKQRSKNMSLIRSRGNKTTEEILVKEFRKNKIRGWQRHVKGSYGSPDFLFRRAKIAVFVDGCFWHGCKRHCIMPKSNIKYWNNKILHNRKRDRKVNLYYKEKGWSVVRIWEHQIKAVQFRKI